MRPQGSVGDPDRLVAELMQQTDRPSSRYGTRPFVAGSETVSEDRAQQREER